MSVLKTYGEDTYGEKPSKTYKLNGQHIEGFIDGVDAVAQSAQLILSTERYEYIIYSHDYGVELNSLVGKRREYVEGDIKRRIEEALSEDDRIEGITDFSISFDDDTATVNFTVVSVFGNFNMERSITIE